MALPALLLAGRLAFADRPHVVILGPSAEHVAVVRMRGELAVLGIDVDVLVHAKATADLEAVARRLGAVAALRVETAPPAIVLWVDPAVAPPGVAAEVRIGGAAEERDPALLALRAVEVLRARLVKVPLALPPPESAADAGRAFGPSPPTPDVGRALDRAGSQDGLGDAGAALLPPASDAAAPPQRTERAHTAGLSAAPAVLLSPGGVPPALEVRIGAGWDPIPRFGLEAMAFIPATAGTVTASSGSVDLRVLAFGGGVRAVLTDPAAPFFVAAGLGVNAMMLSFSGKAEAPLMAESGTRWAVAPYLAATASYRVHAMVSLRLDLLAAIVRPEPVIRIAGQEAASFGLPAMLPSLGVEVRP